MPAADDVATFLLEIGVEELPSGAVAPAIQQLQTALLTHLNAVRLSIPETSVTTFATPRRLTLIARGVPKRQPDAETEVRGPAVKAAYGPDGAPSRAAIGFAAKNGVSVESLTASGDYVVAFRAEVGRPAAEVLAGIVPDLLREVTFSKFMRWGEGNYRWGRPLRRFVALLDDDVIPFTIEGVESGRETAGHRYWRDAVVINSPGGYSDSLRAAGVEPDPEIREAQIIAQANALASSIGGVAVLSPALVDENVYLTEWVTAVLGQFEPAYLSLPRPVLETAMKKHQHFFPVESADGRLLPYFIAIRSGGTDHLDKVRGGYERVLASRFSDAHFFFDHDRQSTLADKAARTERIVFQEKLGTLAAKTNRLAQIMEAAKLFSWTHDAAHARRAAALAKADLASEIVMEFPALQGIMGSEFARLDGEHEAVARSLFEQYLPRTAGDALPQTRIGTALALADRADTLTGYMRFVGAEPKGSSDPFGLKRAASAIVDLLARDRALPRISALLTAAQAAYETDGLQPAAKPGDVLALIEARLRGLLEERQIRYDVIDALLAAPWDNIASVVTRADVLTSMLGSDGEMMVAAAATRVRNMLKSVKEPIAEVCDPKRLTTPEERTLLGFLGTVQGPAEQAIQNGDYTDALDTLAALTKPIDRLFDNVMIMADDLDTRAAQLALLGQIDQLYLSLADFSKIIIE